MNIMMAGAVIVVAGVLTGCGTARREARGWSYAERRLSLTAEQKPLWEAFRRETDIARTMLERERQDARRELAATFGAESFDQNKVALALDEAYANSRKSALLVAGAWQRLHASLSAEQKNQVRELAARMDGKGRRRWR
jgi:Spy/CpxP family protein refolding chaperone